MSVSAANLVLEWSLVLAQVMLVLAMACAALRMLRGPRAQDRILGLDTFYVNSLLLLLTIGIRTGTSLYFEAALIIGMLGFVGTVACAKFLMRGEVIE
ncbi:MAG: K+/H+ antiporter subunit F [Rhizobiales bacterium 32-66-8]|nr:MAG: K+/H+ antiporter subunit F [Rhizobiales bacterium 32-66-8]